MKGDTPLTASGSWREPLATQIPTEAEQAWGIWTATLTLLLLTVAQVALTIWTNYWHRELFDALEARSVSGVLLQVGIFALIFLLTLAVTGAHLMVKRWLQLDWRRWLTDRVIGRWMESGPFSDTW